MSHKKIWIKLTEEKNNTHVIIGASATKTGMPSSRRRQDDCLLNKDRKGK
jgi:hypothetical protein